jgi:hypothetical protein
MVLSGLNKCKNVRNSRNPVRFALTFALFCLSRVLSKSFSRLKKSSYLQPGFAYPWGMTQSQNYPFVCLEFSGGIHNTLERFLTICLRTSQLELQVFPAATYNELVDDPPSCLSFIAWKNRCPKKSAIVTFSPAP